MRYTLTSSRGFAGDDWFKRGGGGATARWGTWLGLMLGGSILLTSAYVLKPPQVFWLDYLTWVIIALFGVLLIKSFADVRTIDREARLAAEQVDLLQREGDVAAFLQHAEKSAFQQHIASLYTIMRAHSDISQDTLIELMHAKLISRNKFGELLSGILITLGLIGTIIGLLISVGPLGKVLADAGGDIQDVKKSLSQTMAGLGTAYYTTLCGAAFGGVILRILTNIIDVAVTQYVALLAELTEVNVLPALRRSAAALEEQGYYRRPVAGVGR